MRGKLTNKYGKRHGQKNIRLRRGPDTVSLAPIDRHIVVAKNTNAAKTDEGKLREQAARDTLRQDIFDVETRSDINTYGKERPR